MTTKSNLCGVILPLIEKFATHEDILMRRNATLALYKLMVAAGPNLCSTYLPLVLTPHLEGAPDVGLQHNAVLALSDVLSRHPNECERSVTGALSSLVATVASRTLSLKVLARLVRNDMIRPRARLLSDILALVTSADSNGVLAREFLVALHSKGKHGYSVVVNTFGEVLVCYASSCREREVEPDREAVAFLTSLLSEPTRAHLVEKIASRLATAYSDNDLARCNVLAWAFQGLLTSEKPVVALHDVICGKTFFAGALAFVPLRTAIVEGLAAVKRRVSKEAQAKISEVEEALLDDSARFQVKDEAIMDAWSSIVRYEEPAQTVKGEDIESQGNRSPQPVLDVERSKEVDVEREVENARAITENSSDDEPPLKACTSTRKSQEALSKKGRLNKALLKKDLSSNEACMSEASSKKRSGTATVKKEHSVEAPLGDKQRLREASSKKRCVRSAPSDDGPSEAPASSKKTKLTLAKARAKAKKQPKKKPQGTKA